MDIKMFEEILTKICLEQSAGNIQLYNWGEPLLHPQYSEMVQLVADRGWVCVVSSNLSHENIDMRAVAEHMPNILRISLSGYYQDTYTKAHRNGQISLVKSNLYKLHHFIVKKHGFEYLNKVEICYHIYKDNIYHDVSNIYWLCQELGFKFTSSLASLMPLEGVLDYLNGNAAENIQVTAERLLIPFHEMLKIAKDNNPLQDCRLRSNQMSINHDGSVGLCCAVYDEKNNISPSFLQSSQKELQEMKYAHNLCQTCMKFFYHSLTSMGDNSMLYKIAKQKLVELNSPLFTSY